MARHYSIFAWETPWTMEPWGPQSKGSQRTTEEAHRQEGNIRVVPVTANIPFLYFVLVPAVEEPVQEGKLVILSPEHCYHHVSDVSPGSNQSCWLGRHIWNV